MRENRVMRVLFVIIFGVIPLVIIPNNADIYFRGKLIAGIFTVGIVFLFYMVYWLYQLVVNGESKIFDVNDRGLATNLILILTGLVIISYFFAINKEVSFYGQGNCPEGLVSFLLYFLVFYLFYRMKTSYSIVYDLILISASVVSLIGILEFFYIIQPLPSYFGIESVSYVNQTTIGNRNFVGSYCVLMFPFAAGLTIFYKKKRGYIYTLLITSLLLVSQTRSAYLSVMIMLVLFVVLSIRHREDEYRTMGIIIAITLFIVTTVVFLYRFFDDNRIIIRIQKLIYDILNFTKDSAGSDRMFYWKNTLAFLFRRPLLGGGPDSFGVIYVEAHGKLMLTYQKAHNEWLNMAVTLGFPFLLTYLALIATSLKRLLVGIKSSNEYKIVFIALVGYIIQSQFNISVLPNALMFYALLGYGAAAHDRVEFDT